MQSCSLAVEKQFDKFTNPAPSVSEGQIIITPGFGPNFNHEFIVESVHDFNNLLSDKILVVCRRADVPKDSVTEWIIADCHLEFGTPVLSKIQKVGCEKNISHFIQVRQKQNYEKFSNEFQDEGAA